MTTAVYRLPETRSVPTHALVCHLQRTSPDEAIETLSRVGVLAVAGPTPSSITLVGFHAEIQTLLSFYRRGNVDTPQWQGNAPRAIAGKVRKLALATIPK